MVIVYLQEGGRDRLQHEQNAAPSAEIIGASMGGQGRKHFVIVSTFTPVL